MIEFSFGLQEIRICIILNSSFFQLSPIGLRIEKGKAIGFLKARLEYKDLLITREY